MPNLLRFSIVSTGSAWQRYIEVDESRTDQAEMTSSLKVLLMATADWVCIVSAGVAEASTRLFPPADSTATEQHSSNVTPHHWEGCLAASPEPLAFRRRAVPCSSSAEHRFSCSSLTRRAPCSQLVADELEISLHPDQRMFFTQAHIRGIIPTVQYCCRPCKRIRLLNHLSLCQLRLWLGMLPSGCRLSVHLKLSPFKPNRPRPWRKPWRQAAAPCKAELAL